MKLIKMFLMLFILSTATLGSEQENCKKMSINGDKIFGECCVFSVDKDLDYKNDNKDQLLPIRNHKSRQPSQDQIIEKVRPLQLNTDLLSPKPIIATVHTGHEKSNVFAPESFRNRVVPFKNDRLYGECDIFMKDEHLPHEIIVAMIEEYLSTKENFEVRRPPLREIIPTNHSAKPPPHFNVSAITRKNDDGPRSENRKRVYLPENFEAVKNKDIRPHQVGSDEAHIEIDDSDFDEEFNNSTTKVYPESLSTSLNDTHMHKVTDSTILKQNTDSTIFPVMTEEADEATTPSKIPDKPVLKIVEDKFNNKVFQVTESLSIIMKDSNLSSSNTNNSRKPVVDLDNRNAVDVPPVGCPNGQGRDPSGTCVSPF